MACLCTTEESPTSMYVSAISYLHDITKIHADSNIADIRASLMHDGSNGALSGFVVRVLEVHGIAIAVANRFGGREPHHTHAANAAMAAAMLSAQMRLDIHKVAARVDAGTPTLKEGDDHAFLLRHLDWVHRDTVHDDTSTGIRTCLCPVTAYLQLILCYTPMKDWAEAAANSSLSPLAFAWAWAREKVGRQTADVAALVTMGRHAHRALVKVESKAEEERSAHAIMKFNTFLEEGCWAGVRVVIKDLVTDAVTKLQAPPSASDKHRHERELIEAKERRETVRDAAQQLGKAGTQYAELLGEDQMAQERENVVDSIRFKVEFILGKAGLPGSEDVLPVIQDLAKAE